MKIKIGRGDIKELVQNTMSEIHLLDIQSDYIFKRVFGTDKNKRLLISLLNAILKGCPHVTDLELQNTEISKIFKDNRTVFLDIKAKIDNKEFVDVEMQICNTGDIEARSVQYAAEMLTLHSNVLTSEEKKVGIKQSYEYPKVIGIWIMGQNVTDRKGAVNEANFAFPPTEGDSYQVLTDKMRIIFIELPKFRPKRIDLKNMLDVWMTFLKDPLNQEIQQVGEVRQALGVLKEISEDPVIREIYSLRQKTEFGHLSEKNVAVDKARKKGIEEGEKIGFKRGENKKALEVACAMLKHGDEAAYIALVSGLSLAEIDKLKASLDI